MSLFSKTHNLVEMRVIDVSIDSEQSLEDLLDDISEILGERNVLVLFSFHIHHLDLPTREGNTLSSSRMLCTQVIR